MQSIVSSDRGQDPASGAAWSKASPIPLLGIDHVVIRVRDLEPMLAFYTDVLGCEVAKHNAPLDLWHLRAGSALIDLVPVNGVLRSGGASGDTEPRRPQVAMSTMWRSRFSRLMQRRC